MPILSVGAITIALWILSLDQCFPLLCWLCAIHPPSFRVTAIGKLQILFTPLLSVLPPPPLPHSQLIILMVLFYTKAFIEKHAVLGPKPVLSV